MKNAMTKALLDLQSLEFPAAGRNLEGVNRLRVNETIQRLRSRVSSDLLHEYDSRKRRYEGTSIVQIANERCTGCQVKVSLRTRRDAEDHLTECEHCGRLIYDTHRHKPIKIEIAPVTVEWQLAS